MDQQEIQNQTRAKQDTTSDAKGNKDSGQVAYSRPEQSESSPSTSQEVASQKHQDEKTASAENQVKMQAHETEGARLTAKKVRIQETNAEHSSGAPDQSESNSSQAKIPLAKPARCKHR